MTQRFSLYEDLSIEENLDFVARMYGVARRASRRSTRRSTGSASTARRAQLAGTLSGGWKQRLALAACMLHSPQLLLLDEPTAGVDPKARRDFWEEIHELAAEGITVLVSTHYMDEAERCHRLAYIAYGKLLVEGTPDEVIAQLGLTTWSVALRGRRRACARALARELGAVRGVDTVIPFGTDAARHRAGRGGARRGARAGTRTRTFDRAAHADHARGRVRQPDAAAQPTMPADAAAAAHAILVRARLCDRAEGIRADAARPADVRDDRRHPDRAGAAVRVRHQFRSRRRCRPPSSTTTAPNSRAASPPRSQNTGYFAFVRVARRSEAEADAMLARGEIQFAIVFPAGFSRELLRGERPSVLRRRRCDRPVRNGQCAGGAVAGRRPTALSHDLSGPLSALAPAPLPFDVRRPAPLQPGRRHAVQHRAGAARGDPAVDDGDDDGVRSHARTRARHVWKTCSRRRCCRSR